LDKAGIPRVGGRLIPINSSIMYNQKHPIILRNGKLSALLFAHMHHALLYCGPQLLLSSIRRLYWPLGARNLARNM